MSINGVVDDLVVNGNVGATSDWAKIEFQPYNTHIFTGISVWDSASDNALTTTKWMPTLRPDADGLKTNWEDQSAGTTNLWEDFQNRIYCCPPEADATR